MLHVLISSSKLKENISESGNDIETQKSTETKPKKKMKKRASVAILVGKFEVSKAFCPCLDTTRDNT